VGLSRAEGGDDAGVIPVGAQLLHGGGDGDLLGAGHHATPPGISRRSMAEVFIMASGETTGLGATMGAESRALVTT